MASMRFAVKPRKDGYMDIRALFEQDGRIRYKNPGFSLPANKERSQYKFWDVKKRRARSVPNAAEINTLLMDWELRWMNYTEDCRLHRKPVDIDRFRDSLPLPGEDKPAIILTGITDHNNPTLVEVIEEFILSVNKTLANGTKSGYDALLEDITNYQNELRRKIYPADICYDFYRNFGLFLITHNENVNTTVNRKIGRIHTIMEFAFPKYIKTQEYKKKYRFKVPEGDQGTRFALWPDEQEQFKLVATATPAEQQFKDLFIFSFLTSLRFSDTMQLYPHHRRDIPMGDVLQPILDLTQIKTTHHNTIALTGEAAAIWDRYAAHPKQPVFRTLNNTATINRYLKKLMGRAGINREVEVVKMKGNRVIKKVVPLHKAISFHQSRNTAITTQLASLPPAIVMKNAGIKNMDTLMRYMKDDQLTRFRLTMEAMDKKDGQEKPRP